MNTSREHGKLRLQLNCLRYWDRNFCRITTIGYIKQIILKRRDKNQVRLSETVVSVYMYDSSLVPRPSYEKVENFS